MHSNAVQCIWTIDKIIGELVLKIRYFLGEMADFLGLGQGKDEPGVCCVARELGSAQNAGGWECVKDIQEPEELPMAKAGANEQGNK